jgi:hypothetical protein
MEADKFSGSDEYPSIVGNFDENGLNVNNWNGNRNDNVGCGASRQLSLYPAERPPLCGRFRYRSLLDLIQPPSIRPISSMSDSNAM